MNNYTNIFNMGSGNIAQINEYIPDTQHSSILEKINKLDQKMDIIINKLDRNTAEMVALRSEVKSIKAEVCGEILKPKEAMP